MYDCQEIWASRRPGRPVTKRTRKELIDAISIHSRRSQNRTDAYDEAVSEAVGINRTDLRCLDILEQEGEATPGRLSELMGLTTGAITTVIDRLERAGYVNRVRDEHDRRRVRVVVSEKAMERLWPYYEPIARMAAEIYDRFTDDQLETVLEFLETGADLHDRVVAELKAKLAAASKPG
jgi:DNA-binding MarR family transcriptional regulator